MNHRQYLKCGIRQGFTLVELLIVVVILTILSAIVVPQFSAATDDAKLSSLDTSLANVRSAVDLYYQQHGEYPGNVASTGGACEDSDGPGGIPGTGPMQTEQAFLDQMSKYTDMNGKSCTKSDTNFKYGPYLKKATLPDNPMTTSNTVLISTAGSLGMTSAVTNGGWKYDTITGQFIVDHSDYDDR